MRLKKLELFGFKSFADKTEVIFDEGVTCIVGPNGCGKSNISDSIRWVLGERSAKMLRGSKMEDVIFNGTDFRKPLALSEVSLTIDNSDRGLPIDYNEVTITRRLYRSGESEYLINKTSCRLKDIQDLILDTGIGSNSYSMIEQGRIDYILNADADERRFLIEEAAGISKFKVKKEEAVRKLERTEENRLRLNDIIQEVHKNIQYAERQAKRAAKYREEIERLKSLEIKRAVLELDQITAKKAELEQEHQQLQAEHAQIEEEISRGRQEQALLQEQLRETLAKYSKAEAGRYAIQSKMDQNSQQMRFNQEKLLETAARKGQIEEEVRQLTERIKQAAVDIASKEQEISSAREEKSQAEGKLQAAENELRSLEAELEKIKLASDELKAQSFQAASETTRLRNEFHRLEAYIETNSQQKKKQEASVTRVRQENEAWVAKKESCEKEITILAARLQEVAEKAAFVAGEITENRARYEACKKDIQETERLEHEKTTRIELLEELEKAARAGEESLLAEISEQEKAFIHSLRDIFKVQPGFEWALEAALENDCRSLIAEDWNTARNLFDRIQNQKNGGLGVFIKVPSNETSASGGLQHPKIQFPLASVVEVREGYAPVFTRLLHNVFVLNSLTASDLEELSGLGPDFKFVSPEGFVLGPAGRLHYRGISSSEQGEFRRTAELNQLKADMGHLKDFLAQKVHEAENCFFRLQELEKEQDALEADKMDTMVRKESFDSMRKGMEDRLVSFQRELDLFGFETRELENEYMEAMSQKARLQAEVHTAEEHEKHFRVRLESLEAQAETMDKEKSVAVQSHAEMKAHFSSLAGREKLLVQGLEMIRDHEARDQERVQSLVNETSSLLEREKSIHSENARIEFEQADLEENRRLADVELEMIRQEKEKQENTIGAIQENLQGRQMRLQELQNSNHQFEMKLMDLGYQQKNIGERLEQTYRIAFSEMKKEDYIKEEDAAIDRTEMDAEIDKLKEKVESLGTVNLLAIEEYEELKTRYDFLMGQQKDLEDAREQLLETIRKINKTTKGLFEETFQNVQKMFQEYYQTLFRGGMAKLTLVDETNPLESGIDIMVRPPGKKNQHISLLSGGEKALTAIALLFALFHIKPSPYCVLDEVDAPLDEANIDRFLGVLKTFLVKSQFIIVTHNRKTIAMGDALYGVTMQEAGVSKLVSVKVNQDSNSASPAVTAKDSSAAEEINA